MHRNNFDFLRLLFASFVIITHSYALTGLEEHDWLYHWSGGQTIFSYIGVRGFFVISGFLIYNSLVRSKTLGEYYYKRMLRLYPGLFAALVITVLLGAMLFNGTISDYISNRTVWTYIPNNLNLFKLQYKIEGMFEQNPFSGFVNGALWTITYELVCYLALSALFFVRSKKWHLNILIGCFLIFVACRLLFWDNIKAYTFYMISFQYIDLFAYFTAGSLLAAIDIQKFVYKNVMFVTALVLFVLSLLFGSFGVFQFFTFPIVVILFGLGSTKGINAIGKTFGDLSYGMYIYGFVVQQTLVQLFNPGYLELMLWALALSLCCGYFSWHFVEKKALKAKDIYKRVPVFVKAQVEMINRKRA